MHKDKQHRDMLLLILELMQQQLQQLHGQRKRKRTSEGLRFGGGGLRPRRVRGGRGWVGEIVVVVVVEVVEAVEAVGVLGVRVG